MTDRTLTRRARYGEVAAAAPALRTVIRSAPNKPIPVARDLVGTPTDAAARDQPDEINSQAPLWNLVARVIRDQKVDPELASLPDDWHVLHTAATGDAGGNIDHLVIGPGGVFTLNTWRHPRGKIWVNDQAAWVDGHRTTYLRNARFEAQRAHKLLSTASHMIVRVEPVLVFVDIDELTIKGSPPADVQITTRPGLRRFLMRHPQRLTSSEVEHIFAVARRSVIWKQLTSDRSDALPGGRREQSGAPNASTTGGPRQHAPENRTPSRGSPSTPSRGR